MAPSMNKPAYHHKVFKARLLVFNTLLAFECCAPILVGCSDLIQQLYMGACTQPLTTQTLLTASQDCAYC